MKTKTIYWAAGIITALTALGVLYIGPGVKIHITGPADANRVVCTAAAKNDPAYCERIRMGFDGLSGNTTESLQNYCYFMLAYVMDDDTICSNIRNEDAYLQGCVQHNAREDDESARYEILCADLMALPGGVPFP